MGSLPCSPALLLLPVMMWDVMWDDKTPMGSEEVSQMTSDAAGGYCWPSSSGGGPLASQLRETETVTSKPPIRGHCCTPGGEGAICEGVGKRNYMRSPGWTKCSDLSCSSVSTSKMRIVQSSKDNACCTQRLARAWEQGCEAQKLGPQWHWVKEKNTCLSF